MKTLDAFFDTVHTAVMKRAQVISTPDLVTLYRRAFGTRERTYHASETNLLEMTENSGCFFGAIDHGGNGEDIAILIAALLNFAETLSELKGGE